MFSRTRDEVFSRTRDHDGRGGHLLGPACRRGRYVHDDRALQVDQIVDRVGEGRFACALGRPGRSRVGQGQQFARARFRCQALGLVLFILPASHPRRRCVECCQVLPHGPRGPVRVGPFGWQCAPVDPQRVAGVCLDDTGIGPEALAAHKPGRYAAAHHPFEHAPEHLGLAETTVPRLRED